MKIDKNYNHGGKTDKRNVGLYLPFLLQMARTKSFQDGWKMQALKNILHGLVPV